MLQGKRHRRPPIGAQPAQRRDAARPPGHEAAPQPRHARPLRQRVEGQRPLGIGPQRLRHPQQPRGGRLGVDLGIALVRQHPEIVPLRQRQQPAQIIRARHRALRVRRRADEAERHPVQQLARQPRIIGQEAGRLGGGHRHQLRTRRQRPGTIGLIEGVRHQHHRPRARLALRRQRQCRVEQPLAGAVQHQDAGLGIDLRPEAAPDPARDRRAQPGRALVRRIAREVARMLGHHPRHHLRLRMPRLADRHRDLRPARRMPGEQLSQARKGVLRQAGEPLGKLHLNASSPGSFTAPVATSLAAKPRPVQHFACPRPAAPSGCGPPAPPPQPSRPQIRGSANSTELPAGSRR